MSSRVKSAKPFDKQGGYDRRTCGISFLGFATDMTSQSKFVAEDAVAQLDMAMIIFLSEDLYCLGTVLCTLQFLEVHLHLTPKTCAAWKMAWFWGSKPAASHPTPPESSATQPETTTSTAAVVPPPAPVPEPVQHNLSREEQADQELLDLVKQLQAQAEIEDRRRQQPKEKGSLAHSAPAPPDISPDSLFPTEISCRSAFDYAMFCQSFGGQFVNIYRYGTFRSCSNHWDDFWLCMRTRNWNKDERAAAIQEHYRKRAVKWKTGPSSEDVWEVREEPIKNAFSASLEEFEARNPDQEWEHGKKPFNSQEFRR